MTPFEAFANQFKQKKVLILGLGTQGRGVGDAKVMAQIGARVTVTDLKTQSQLASSLKQLQAYPLTFHLGGHSRKDILESDFIIRNASVPYNHPLLQLARSKKIPIYMDAALFFRFAAPTKAIGITGTRGKTTTTHLIFQLIRQAYKHVEIAGNASPKASLELLQNFNPNTWYVFELSSWQLQGFHDLKLSPRLSVVTNFFPDHLLDRTFDQYIFDKSAIYAYQSSNDFVFANQEDSLVVSQLQQAPSNVVWFSVSSLPRSLKINLPGNHNRTNAAAAYAVAKHLNIPLSTIKHLFASFSPLPYRLEPVATINGIKIINDSTSTTPAAAIAALNTYPRSHVILGGTSKKLPLEDLAKTLKQKAKAIYLLSGSGTNELIPHLDPNQIVQHSQDLSQLLKLAMKNSKPGDVILFSPAFTSFELFQNEFDRGQQFNQLIRKLKKN